MPVDRKPKGRTASLDLGQADLRVLFTRFCRDMRVNAANSAVGGYAAGSKVTYALRFCLLLPQL